jgi:hypothetical protein
MIVDENKGDQYLEFNNQSAHIIEYDNIVNSLLSIYNGEIEYGSKLETVDI